MPFSDLEIAEHTQALENHFWSRRRPPLHLRGKVREGQRFTEKTIELFFVRPAYNRPGEEIEEPIAKIQHLPLKGFWRLFWKRADGHWHRYKPCPETATLPAALRIIDEDAHACFFG
jgi:hypothetical protein